MTPGIVIYRLDDRLFFANAGYVKGRVREAIRAAPTETSWLVFDAEAVSHVDSTGIEALGELARELRDEQVTLVVARLRSRLLLTSSWPGRSRRSGVSASTRASTWPSQAVRPGHRATSRSPSRATRQC